jgi:hypothetical protein
MEGGIMLGKTEVWGTIQQVTMWLRKGDLKIFF